MPSYYIRKGHYQQKQSRSEVDRDEKEWRRKNRRDEYTEDPDDIEEDPDTEVEVISKHKTYKYGMRVRVPGIEKYHFCSVWVNIGNRGRSIIASAYGKNFPPDTPFMYEGQAANGSAIVFAEGKGSQFNIPFDCLIFTEHSVT